MRCLTLLTSALACATSIQALSVPEADVSLSIRDRDSPFHLSRRAPDQYNPLEKRKGGGGGGGGRGGSSGSSSSSSSSSGSGRSGSSGSSSSSASNARANSNVGGRTSSGTGVRPAYGGGYYGGGSSVPYTSGQRSPKGLITPFFLAPLAVVALFPGLWLWGANVYNFHNPFTFVNHSAINDTLHQGINTTLPVVCLCDKYEVCGCDDNSNTTYINDLIGNGSYAALNKTLINVADDNGVTKIILNGTLPNGTTAAGGTDNAAGISLHSLGYSGWWVAIGIAVYAALLL